MTTYTPAEVAKRLSISPSSVRNYCRNPLLREFLSADATPAAGASRRLTENDVHVLALTHRMTRQGLTLATVADRIRSGDVDPDTATPPDQEETPPTTALVLANTAVTALRSQLEDARHREAELTERLLLQAQRIGQLEGELKAQQQRPLTFWQRLFRGQ